MSVQTIIIRPNGDVRIDARDAMTVARAEIGELLTVVTLRAPILDDLGTVVAWLDDFGAMRDDAELNVKAWALYGASPLFGTAVIARDDGRPFNAGLITALEYEWHHWSPPHAVKGLRALADSLGVEL